NPREVIIQGNGGSGVMRPLERSARAKGVEILLQHRMIEIHREGPKSGRVIGITAMQVDKWFKPGFRTLNIRARKGVIVATGGHSTNVEFRRIFDPRLTEEYSVWGDAWTKKFADAELQGMAVGASLWGTANQTNGVEKQLDRGSIGTRANGSP